MKLYYNDCPIKQQLIDMHLLFTLKMTFYADIGLLQNYLTLKQKMFVCSTRYHN